MKQKTKNFREVIEKYLTKRFGEVRPEWYISIDMLCTNIELHDQCVKELKKMGMLHPQTGKRNELLLTVTQLQSSILREIQHLGLSPYSDQKIKSVSTDDSELLGALLGTDEDDAENNEDNE